MRYINLRFTYLLTYLHNIFLFLRFLISNSFFIILIEKLHVRQLAMENSPVISQNFSERL